MKGTEELSPELAPVVHAWSKLPDAIKAGIVAMVEAVLEQRYEAKTRQCTFSGHRTKTVTCLAKENRNATGLQSLLGPSRCSGRGGESFQQSRRFLGNLPVSPNSIMMQRLQPCVKVSLGYGSLRWQTAKWGQCGQLLLSRPGVRATWTVCVRER